MNKVIKYFDITATKDISGNYPINNFGDYDFVYCSEDEKFYSSSDLEKNYEELFGKNASVPYIDIVNNSLKRVGLIPLVLCSLKSNPDFCNKFFESLLIVSFLYMIEN